jgi:hypothetical protein
MSKQYQKQKEKWFNQGRKEAETELKGLDALGIKYREGKREGRKEIFLDIIKRKFKGSVRDFLIWYGGEFKEEELVEKKE